MKKPVNQLKETAAAQAQARGHELGRRWYTLAGSHKLVAYCGRCFRFVTIDDEGQGVAEGTALEEGCGAKPEDKCITEGCIDDGEGKCSRCGYQTGG